MTATLDDIPGATNVTSGSILDFDLIKQRAAEILGIDQRDVTDIVLGKLFGLTRESIWRFRKGGMKPKAETALSMAQTLGLSVEALMGNPTPKPKPGPSSPTPKPGPASPGRAA